MTVATFKQPDYTSDTAAAYKAAIDAAIAVLAQAAGGFAPHEAATPDMTVVVDAGRVFDGASLVEKSQQTTGTITAPSTNPRIDRVVIDRADGTVSVVTGTEAASPVAPAIPAGKLPVAQVALATSTTTITNSLITDERAILIPWKPSLAKAYISSPVSTSSATTKIIPFDAEIYDTDGYHDNATNNNRLTAPSTGKYRIGVWLYWASNTTGHRVVTIYHKNGGGLVQQTVNLAAQDPSASSGICYQNGSVTLWMAAGDYVEVQVVQTSGGSLNVAECEFEIERVDTQ